MPGDSVRHPGRVAVVGPCGAGKSELVRRLRSWGYEARECAQEHSYVPDMWQRLSRPEVLVYLDASAESIGRRLGRSADPAYLAEQRRRLAHAREHCNIYVHTDGLESDEVATRVRAALRVPRPADGEMEPPDREQEGGAGTHLTEHGRTL